MQWKEISVYTQSGAVDLLCAQLMDLGLGGFVVEDPADFLEFKKSTIPHWDFLDDALLQRETAPTRVILYLPDNEQGHETFLLLRTLLEEIRQRDESGFYGDLHILDTNLSQEDWETSWKQYYKPVKIGRRLVIIPRWEEYAPKPEEIPLYLDPGMAFGTGTHATTRLCLLLLESSVKPGCRVLDVGCGSGILAIGAALLGAEQADGVDIDQLAAQIAGENAALNGVQQKTTFRQGDLTAQFDQKYDVICANIVADVILRLIPDVPKLLAPDGVFLVSGIIDSRKEEILAALTQQNFAILEVLNEEDWVAVKAAHRG